MQKITPFLWFNGNAEPAVDFYCSVFRNAKKGDVSLFPEGAPDSQPGSVMTVEFELLGMEFVALNGGPAFQFSQATSFVVNCENQQEVDYYWDKLSEGGEVQMCGWLIDKFGVSWQITPVVLMQLLSNPDKDKVQRGFDAMLQMQKIDIATIERAIAG